MGRLLDLAGYQGNHISVVHKTTKETKLTKEGLGPLPLSVRETTKETNYTKKGLAVIEAWIGASGLAGPMSPADSWDWILERSSIMEFQAGLSRDEADARAFEEWFKCFVGVNS